MKPQQLIIEPEILEYVKSYLMNLLDKKLCHLVLFGSHARGDYSADSDIDILLVTATKLTYEEKDKITELELEMLEKHNLYFSITIEEQNFVDKYSWLPFYKNISKDGISLYG